MRTFRGSLVSALAVLAGALGSPPGAATPAELLEEVRASSLQIGTARHLIGVDIPLGPGRLLVEDGLLFAATPLAGRATEFVLIGRARFDLEAPDAMEAAQLELHTGGASLSEPIERAVLALTDAGAVRGLLDGHSVAAEAEAATRAHALFKAWKAAPERERLGVERALVMDAAGDASMAGFFAAWLESARLGKFTWQHDPEEVEPYVLGRFVPIELGDHAGDVLKRHVHREQRRGRLRGLRAEQLGDWDMWMDTDRASAGASPRPGGPGFEPSRYTLDVSIDDDASRLRGRARVDLRLQRDGQLALSFSLFRDFQVHGVRDVREGRGGPLEWLRFGPDLVVFVPEPARKQATFALEIEWSGVAFDELDPGVFVLRDTDDWYPRGGTIDRAPHDVTLRWPARLEVLAPGTLAEAGTSQGRRFSRHVIEVPTSSFTFEMGKFDLHREQVGHVELVVGFQRHPGVPGDIKAQAITTLRESLRQFEETFGKFPLDRLVVATIPRRVSQGFLGMLTLSHSLLQPDASDEERTEILAHEMAHQWWGNKVGWSSYRDQWLSEALADYSSALFTYRHLGRDAGVRLRLSTGWRKSLTAATDSGRPVESMGPVVMGHRLASSRAPGAYRAIVYQKGALVFEMLARRLGDEPFLGMLKSLSDTVSHRVIDTPTFLRAIEHMSGADLGEFADRFVYGTGIPEVRYRYTVEPAESGWRIEGEARTTMSGVHRFRAVRVGETGWDVARERVNPVGVGDTILVAPFQVAVEGGTSVPRPEDERMSRKPLKVEIGRGGVVRLRGAHSRFAIELPDRPKSLWLDQRGEVLALFGCENRDPKHTLREEGEALAAAGDATGAEEVLRRALVAPLRGNEETQEAKSERQTRASAALEDALVHLALCRLHLDQGRDQQAQAALAAAEGLLKSADTLRFTSERDALRSRLELRRGDFDSVYDRLSRSLRLVFPQKQGESMAEQLRRVKFADGREGTAEDYVLLAAAARGRGEGPEEVFRRALLEARRRGADVSALEAASSTGRGGN